jgi:predicted type IV restriction endonuclease
MTDQELAYTEIERLVKSFKDMPASQRKGMNEMQTRLGYILPLFKALGWDTSNINEVNPEEDQTLACQPAPETLYRM